MPFANRQSLQLESCSSRLHPALDCPKFLIHLVTLEPPGLELLIRRHPLERIPNFVEIADSPAISVGSKEPPHSLGHDGQLFERIAAAVQPFQVIPSSRAIFGWRRPPFRGTQGNRLTRIEKDKLLQPDVQLPICCEVVFIAKARSAMQTETGKRNVPNILVNHPPTPLRNAVIPAVNAKAVPVVRRSN
jgi:hypothetical protein